MTEAMLDQVPIDARPKWPYVPHAIQYEVLRYFGLVPHDPPPDGKPCNIVLMAGEGQGGKSMTARMLAVRLNEVWPGSVGAIFRRITGDLDKTQVRPLLAELPEGMGSYNETKKTYTFKDTGTEIRYHHCLEDLDYLQFRSHLWDWLVIEESTEFTWEQITFFWSRVVGTRAGWRPLVLMTTNSIGVSHLEHKLAFVSGHTGFTTWEGDAKGGGSRAWRYGWIPIKLVDNPSVDFGTTRAGQLSIADEQLRKSMAEGSWDLNAGQFFSAFRKDVHVVPHSEPGPDWRVWRALDYGEAAPAACLWGARDPSRSTPNTYIFQEWVQAGVPPQLQARIILSLSEAYPQCRRTLYDPSIGKQRKGGVSGPTLKELYVAGARPHDLGLVPANNDRVAGWSRVQQGLYRGWTAEVPPEITISERCTEVIKFLETAQRDPHNMADTKDAENASGWRDDAGDSLRYLLMGAQPERLIPRVLPVRYGARR